MMEDFYFDAQNRFVIRNYHHKPAFASFLPGIAGLMGIPMWVFYVNRGQAIASFGIESKDMPIVEYQPANKAYQQVSVSGFRTFIKIEGNQGAYYEPFGFYRHDKVACERQMAIGMNQLVLVEESSEHDLRVEIRYFTLTDEPFAGLVRKLTITNTGQNPITFSAIDGLPQIAPYGVDDGVLKNMSRTAEAWMSVSFAAPNVPFYRLRSSISDHVEIESYEAGHFYVAFDQENVLLPAIVDPDLVFGENTSLRHPDRFLQNNLETLCASYQIMLGKTPCGFFGTEETLEAGDTLVINGVIGHAPSIETLRAQINRITQTSFITEQNRKAHDLARNLTDVVAIQTSHPRLDAYTRQTFLDNVLRGGWPHILKSGDKQFVQHVYSRKHGDLERDYNAFFLAAEPFSQGNGNYRDVNQNRREDVWLNPEIDDYNIITFMNLLQTDGYNPLVVNGNRYQVREDQQADLLALVDVPDKLAAILSSPFTPGSLLKALTVQSIGVKVSPQEFLSAALAVAEQHFEAIFGEGYWIDHWTYNLDLIENYLSIYPDRQQHLLFQKSAFTFYDSAHIVLPRTEKYILVGGVVRQRNAVQLDPEKASLIASRTESPNIMRTKHGRGEIFRTTLINKLICLAAVKFATIDPAGMGIEMEANKPGWYDALNGLPGLFGSSLPEAFELIRLLAFIREALSIVPFSTLELPVEVMELLFESASAVDAFDSANSPDRDVVFWDAAATARERYRESTRLGFSGVMETVSVAQLDQQLARFEKKMREGTERASTMNDGIPPTYLRFEATDYELVESSIRVKSYKRNMLPLFLEGPVRRLRIETHLTQANELHHRVKNSPLYDRKLGMYKVNTALDGEPLDIGRARAFPQGWLENESIWLHMEYKYLLALLRAGLYQAFYDEFKNVLIPFQPPERYGRSPLENSSFIVSSAHPDESLHGRGFIARLSGSTAEYLSILNHLMFGPKPFDEQDGRLVLRFAPILAGWLFNDEGVLNCTFLGKIKVTYLNPARRSTFGPDRFYPTFTELFTNKGKLTEIIQSEIPEPFAGQIRRGEISQVTIHLNN